MFCQAGFDQWLTTIMQPLPDLSKPQATVLALWSFGMVLARSCALTAVSHVLAQGMPRKEQRGRQQRRAWDDDAPRTRGLKRQALHAEACFPGVLGWVGRGWHGRPRALALDATAWGRRLVVLAVSVGYRGGAMPVAWVVWPATTPQAWRREWRRRLRRRRPAIPRGWTVIVLTDRGWEAPGRLWRIGRWGWHPFVRRTTGGTLRPVGTPCLRPVKRVGPQPGTRWRGRGTALQKAGRPVECTRLALGEEGYPDPWLRRTDLPPAARAAGG
jgi:hypothetical protein